MATPCYLLLLALLCSAAAAPGTAYSDDWLFPINWSGTYNIRNGMYRDAIDELRKKTGENDTAFYLFKLATAFSRNKDTSKAITTFRKVIAQDSLLAPLAWETMGDLQLKKMPDSAAGCYGKALTSLSLERYRTRLFEKIHECIGNDTAKIRSAACYTAYTTWWRSHCPPPPDPLPLRVDTLLANNGWKGIDSLIAGPLANSRDSSKCAIVNACDRALPADTALATATIFLLAKAAADCRMFPAARRLLAAAQAKPDFTAIVAPKTALRFTAGLSYGEGKYGDAIKQFKAFMKAYAFDPDLALLVAKAYRSLDSLEKSAAWYDRFIAASPRYPALSEILWRRAWIAEEQHRSTSAMAFYRRLYRSYPKSSRADESFFRHALCYYRMDKFDSSAKFLDRFIQKNDASPFFSAASYWRAKSLLGLDKINEARDLLKTVARREPYDYYAHRARDLLTLMGDSIDARLSIDTMDNKARTLRWLDSLGLPTCKPLSPEDSQSLKRGICLAAIGATGPAQLFLEPIELSYPGNLSLQFRIAVLYRMIGAWPQAAASGRRFSWRIPLENRDFIPLSVFSLSYPLYYGEIILAEAQRWNVDPDFIRAVIRQESVFNPMAVSSAGAIGLMQIMPSTGRALAKEMGEPFSLDSLSRPEKNIRFGTCYLRKLLDQFNENEVLVLASYNGGPPNAKEWFLRNREKDFDLFVEDIDFSETRNYVKKVLGNYWFYRKLSRTGAFYAKP